MALFEQLRVSISLFAQHRKTSPGFAMRYTEQISSTDLLGEYRAFHYYPPTGDLYFEVLTRLDDVVSFEPADAEIREVDGTQVRIATHAAVYELKRRSVRLQEHADATALHEQLGKMKSEKRVQKFRPIEK
jgi:hypothetical protein